MNSTANKPLRLLTWLDVERLLKAKTELWHHLPQGIVAVDCFASGLDIYYTTQENVVDDWLTELFGHLYLKDQRHIQLQISGALYPVTPIHDPGATHRPPPNFPLWRDMVYLERQPGGGTDDASRSPGPTVFSHIIVTNSNISPELPCLAYFPKGAPALRCEPAKARKTA